METLDNSISDKNKVPGSGCDSFTRPEEIKALGKFLSQLKEAYVDSTQLETEITGVPGKTTGKFPNVNLEDSVEELDISRENKLRELSSKLVSLDKSFSQNLDGKLEHLPENILKIDENPLNQLSQRLISLSNSSGEINLSEKKDELEVSNENIELSETKDLLKVENNVELEKDTLTLDIEESNDLEDTRLNLEVKSEIELGNKVLDLSADSDSSLENTRLNLDIKVNDNLENKTLQLKVNSNIDLESKVSDLIVEGSTELESRTLQLKADSDSFLEDTKLELDTDLTIELSNSIQDLKIEDDITLEDAKLNLEVDKESNLGDSIIQLSVDSNIDLSETKLSLETEDNTELEDLLLTLELDESSFLEDSTLNLEVNSDIELENSILSLDPTVDSELNDKILNLEINSDTELENNILSLDPTVDSELNDKILNLEVNSDTDLGEFRLELSVENKEELENSKLSLEVNTKTELESTRLDLVEESNIELESDLLKLKKSEEVSLEDTIDSLFTNNEVGLEEEKLSLPNELQEIYKLSKSIGKINKIDNIIDPVLYSDPDREKIFGDLKETIELENTKLIPTIEGEIGSLDNKPYDFFGDDETTLPYQETLDLLKYKSPDGDNNYEYFEPDGGTLYDSILEPTIEGEIGSLKDKPYDFFGDDETILPYSGVYTLGSAISGEINRGDSSYEWDSEDSNLLLYGSSVLEHPITIREGSTLREGKSYSFINTEEDSNTDKDDIFYSSNYIKGLIVDVSPDAGSNSLFIESINSGTSSEDDTSEDSTSVASKWNNWKTAEEEVFNFTETKDIIDNNTGHGEFVLITESSESTEWNTWMERLKSKLNGKIVDHLRYKLPDFDPHVGSNYDINSYIRWTAEELVEPMGLTGDLRKAVLDELIYGFITTRNVTEKVLETNKDRLPGQPLLGVYSNFVSDGVGPENIINTLGNSISDALSPETDNPINRPSKKGNTTGWTKANSDIPVLVAEQNSNTSKKGFWKKLLDTFAVNNNPEENYKFKDAYLEGKGIMTTITDLAGSTIESVQSGSLESFYDLLKSSPYITTAEKVTSTGNGLYNITTLDSNTHWEVIFEPYIGELNGYYTFLPSINEINVRNEELHGINTQYSRWIPFTSFDLQKEKLVTKSLGLYEGELSYPTSMEFTNELRMTLVDDQFKSWKTYFERCAYASVYSSTPREDENNDPIIIDRKYNLVAPYKNISFRCRIYVMTPQKSTVSKFDLLLILKDYTVDYTGDIDSSAPDLNLTFSIVGENPPETKQDSGIFTTNTRKQSIESYQEKLKKEVYKDLGASITNSLTSTAIKLL